MNKFIQLLLAISFLTAGWQAQAAAPVCAAVHHQVAHSERFIQREELATQLLRNQIPSVAIPTSGGSIPAILFNTQTAPQLRQLLDHSIGTVVNYQPEYNNDHGLIRLFGVLADMDTPGFRRQGEIHQTGLSWVNMNDVLAYSQGRDRVKIEVVYSLSQQEAKVAMAYHLMRRAAIIRVPFRFGGAQPQKGLMNLLENSGEHCFIYCGGSSLSSQISEIRSKIEAYKVGTADQLIAQEDVSQWLQKVEKELLATAADDVERLNPALPVGLGVPRSVADSIGALNPQQKAEFLNWLVGYSISKKYASLIRTLGVPGDNAYGGIRSPRAVAVLVYDGMSTPEQFQSKDYVKRGKFSTWTHQNAQALAEAYPEAANRVAQIKALAEAEAAAAAARKETEAQGWLRRVIDYIAK